MPPNDPTVGKPAATEGDERKPYEPPDLVVYGPVDKLTTSLGGTGTDLLQGSTLG